VQVEDFDFEAEFVQLGAGVGHVVRMVEHDLG
jgi:hypothetical protein